MPTKTPQRTAIFSGRLFAQWRRNLNTWTSRFLNWVPWFARALSSRVLLLCVLSGRGKSKGASLLLGQGPFASRVRYSQLSAGLYTPLVPADQSLAVTQIVLVASCCRNQRRCGWVLPFLCAIGLVWCEGMNHGGSP